MQALVAFDVILAIMYALPPLVTAASFANVQDKVNSTVYYKVQLKV